MAEAAAEAPNSRAAPSNGRPFSEVVDKSYPRFPEALKVTFFNNFEKLMRLLSDIDTTFDNPKTITKGFLRTKETISRIKLNKEDYDQLFKCFNPLITKGSSIFILVNEIKNGSPSLRDKLITRTTLSSIVEYLKLLKTTSEKSWLGKPKTESCAQFNNLIARLRKSDITDLLSSDPSKKGFPYFQNIFGRSSYLLKKDIDFDEQARINQAIKGDRNLREYRIEDNWRMRNSPQREQLERDKKAREDKEEANTKQLKQQLERDKKASENAKRIKNAANKAERKEIKKQKQLRNIEQRNQTRNIKSTNEGGYWWTRFTRRRQRIQEAMDAYDKAKLEEGAIEKARTAAQTLARLENEKRQQELLARAIQQNRDELERQIEEFKRNPETLMAAKQARQLAVAREGVEGAAAGLDNLGARLAQPLSPELEAAGAAELAGLVGQRPPARGILFEPDHVGSDHSGNGEEGAGGSSRRSSVAASEEGSVGSANSARPAAEAAGGEGAGGSANGPAAPAAANRRALLARAAEAEGGGRRRTRHKKRQARRRTVHRRRR